MGTGNRDFNGDMVCIREFIISSTGLMVHEAVEDIVFQQKHDKKKLRLVPDAIQEVLSRQDLDGKKFLQVNFTNQTKILITDTLIGFKPLEITGLDMSKIPKVVTTPDIVSVQQAIEDCLLTDQTDELEVLKRVYLSILGGATRIGFSMDTEVDWISSFATKASPAAA